MTEEVKSYYSEKDPVLRKEILLARLSENPEDSQWNERKLMYEKRFGKIKKNPKSDEFMLAWTLLETASYQSHTVFKSGLKRDVKKAVATLGFNDDVLNISDARKLEIKDVASQYIGQKIDVGTSRGTPFNQILSGLCNEIYLGAVDGLKGYGYVEESKVMFEIFKEAFFECSDEAEEFWTIYFRKKIKEES